MGNKLKLAVVHFTHQNLMQICACTWIYCWTKNYGKSGLGHRAAEPWVMGRGSWGPRAVLGRRPLDLQVARLPGRGCGFSKTRWFSTIPFTFHFQEAMEYQ